MLNSTISYKIYIPSHYTLMNASTFINRSVFRGPFSHIDWLKHNINLKMIILGIYLLKSRIKMYFFIKTWLTCRTTEGFMSQATEVMA